MKYLKLPKIGQVSRIALGTGKYGKEIPEEIAFEELDIFLEKGGNLIDTAHVYGQSYDNGPSLTEITIGKWLKGKKRDAIVLATKGGFPRIGHRDQPRLDKDSLLSDMKASLEYLGTPPDIYFLHRDDPDREVGDMLETLNMFIENGWTQIIGASNWSNKRIEEANKYASTHGLEGFSISQLQFSVHKATREMFQDKTIEILGQTSSKEWYEKNNFPFMAYTPLMRGIFQKMLGHEADKVSDDMKKRYINAENEERLSRAREVCKEFNLTPSELMFGYVLSQKAPSIAILASQNPEHIIEMMDTYDIEIPANVLEYIDKGIGLSL